MRILSFIYGETGQTFPSFGKNRAIFSGDTIKRDTWYNSFRKFQDDFQKMFYVANSSGWYLEIARIKIVYFILGSTITWNPAPTTSTSTFQPLFLSSLNATMCWIRGWLKMCTTWCRGMECSILLAFQQGLLSTWIRLILFLVTSRRISNIMSNYWITCILFHIKCEMWWTITFQRFN